jgi:hypothetical protein
MIVAGLYYGQYCSQYTARSLASSSAQNKEQSQLLLGVNALKVATAMKLQATEWNTGTQTTTSSFLLWVKKEVQLKRPVAIGVFTNEYKFYGYTNLNAGDPDYDHIVPVTGVSTTNKTIYLGSDTLYYGDNGLWTPNNLPTYNFSATFDTFPKSRSGANAQTGPVYSLNNNKQNYGISISGIKDTNKDTVPVRLTTSVNSEVPIMVEGATKAPTATNVTLTATVSIPNTAVAYKLYMYKDFASVPTSQFNANAAKASRSWSIPSASGSTFTTQVTILSNQTAVFRAVKSSAP